LVLGLFKDKQSYKDFVYDQIGYAKEVAKIQHLTIEGVETKQPGGLVNYGVG